MTTVAELKKLLETFPEDALVCTFKTDGDGFRGLSDVVDITLKQYYETITESYYEGEEPLRELTKSPYKADKAISQNAIQVLIIN